MIYLDYLEEIKIRMNNTDKKFNHLWHTKINGHYVPNWIRISENLKCNFKMTCGKKNIKNSKVNKRIKKILELIKKKKR